MIVSDAELRVALGLTPTISDAQTARLMLAQAAGHAAIRKYIHYDPEQKVGDPEFYPRADSLIDIEEFGGAWDKVGGKGVQIAESRAFKYLQLQRIPVRQISDLRVDYSARFGQQSGDFPSSTAWVAGRDYAVEWDRENYCPSGQVIAMSGWPATLGTVKVTYRAGYSPTEFNGPAATTDTSDNGYITVQGVDASPLKAACLLECIRAYHTTANFAQSSLTGMLVPGPKQSESLGSYSYSLAGSAGAMLASMAMGISPQASQLCEPFVNYGVLVG